ncbi:DegT/DnrJ/EryC1/StrS family aminotransferase [Dietzia cercidiphylli]|uniref:DegT/DnrJ/EryC1/StrS family aminotransferase n=1 Tax=Dietzia cercidiphylli TaxID=498199 RepID=UPI003F7F304E
MSWPPVDEATLNAVYKVLSSGRLSVSWRADCGSESVERTLAREFATVYECPTAVSVDHGTSGLVVALESLGVGPGDEVIVPSVTWVAPATAVLRAGAVPILADVDPITGCISAETVSAVVSHRTVGVIVVHLTGYVADMGAILSFCGKAGLWCVEDCSQAHLCEWNHKKVGTLGDIGVLSLGAAKQIPAGEGGMVLSRHSEFQTTLEQLRADSRRSGAESIHAVNHCLIEDGSTYGTNYCMSELSAAVALDQLGKYREVSGLVQGRMEKLAESFMSSSVLAGMKRSHWETNQVCYEYPLRLLRTDIYDAETMIRRLRAVNIDAYKVRNPLFDSDLFSPNNHPQFRSRAGLCMENWTSQYPGAVAYSQGTVLFHHSVFQLDSCSYERLVERFDCLISELSR